MKLIKKRLTASIAVLALLSTAGLASASQPQRPEFVPGELLIKFDKNATPEETRSALLKIRGKLKKKMKLADLQLVNVPVNTVKMAIRQLGINSVVEYAEPNYFRYMNASDTGTYPDDSQFDDMWGLHNEGQTGGTANADIDAPESWDITTGNPDMVVAVIDSGADMEHEDLAANIWTNPGEIPENGIDDDNNGYIDDVHGWDFAHDDNDPSDTDAICGGHGTHTAGTIGAVGDNEIGVTGINWNVQVMPLKIFKRVLGLFCSTTSADIVDAIKYASTMGVRVSNNSYGGGPPSQAEYDAIRASDMVFVAAAGNEGRNNDTTPSYPASYNLDNIIAVAATDHNDNLASFSNYGNTIDIAAPGVQILSTTPYDTYDFFNGTSMASPHVAGAAGMLLGENPQLTTREVKWNLLNGADDKGLPVLTGARLNLYNSLTMPEPVVTIDVSQSGTSVVYPGEQITYNVSVFNTSTENWNVQVDVIAITPNGHEINLAGVSVNLMAGESKDKDFNLNLPASLPEGDYRISGRAEVADTSFDEDQVTYSVID